MSKLVLKTIFSTLAVMFGIAFIFFGVMSLAAPGAMLEFSDGIGLQRLSAAYSVSIYERSGRVNDLANAVERNYYAEEYSVAAELGVKLREAKSFQEYCALRDRLDSEDLITSGRVGNYEQYITGIISVSLYRSGQKEKAVEVAFSALKGEFPANNSVEYLADAVLAEQDSEYCRILLDNLGKLQVEDTEQRESLETLEGLLRKEIND